MATQKGEKQAVVMLVDPEWSTNSDNLLLSSYFHAQWDVIESKITDSHVGRSKGV